MKRSPHANSILSDRHPSFKCAKATFVFANIITGPFGGINDLIVVEAPNNWAVQAIEAVLSLNQQKVNPTCEILMVHTDFDRISVRYNKINEMSYLEFMTEIVDLDFLNHESVLYAFEQSITEDELEECKELFKASAFVKAMNTTNEPVSITSTPERAFDSNEVKEPTLISFPGPAKLAGPVLARPTKAASKATGTEEKPDAEESDIKYQQVVAALVDLGYKKPVVQMILNSLGKQVDILSMEEIIKICLQKAAS